MVRPRAKKSYVEAAASSDDEASKKGDDDVVEFSDSSSEDEAPPQRTPKPPPKKRLKGAPPPKKPAYKEVDSDDSGPDDAELEGDDSDFEVGETKRKTPSKAKPKAKTPSKKAKSSPKKSPKKAANGKAKKPAATPSRASGRAVKPTRYSVDSESEEESESESESEDERVPLSKRAKASAKKPANNKKTVQRSNLHPPVSEMIPQAIRRLRENPKKGSSLAAIKGFMAETWDVNIKQLNTKIKNYIINAVEDGELIRKSGSGIAGRFTVPGMKYKPKKKRKKIIKSDDEEKEDEGEYKPIKRARDEDREKEEKEKEERRLQRLEIEHKKALAREAERAAMPKKPVKKQEEYEVEYIKSKKEVGDTIFYQVKYRDFKKLWWEPEENLTGCSELVENFYLEEKIRLAEKEEEKKEMEDGEFVVSRILEVRFPKGKPREFLIRWKGCGEDDDTWEPEENLYCTDLIEKFMRNHEKMLEVSQKSLRIDPKPIARLNYTKNKRVVNRTGGTRVTYEGMDD